MSLLMLTVFAILLAYTAEFINGWTDAPNAIATVVATGTLPIAFAIPLAAVLNAAGTFAGTAVAATIGTGIVTPDSVTVRALAATMVAIIAWGAFAARVGLPVSKSHALLAGLAGAGVAGSGMKALMWVGWSKVLEGLALSLLFGFAAALVFGLVLILLFSRVKPGKAGKWFGMGHIVSAGTMAFTHGMNDGQKFIGIIALMLLQAHLIPVFRIDAWVIVSCSLVMGLGTALGGWRIIHTIGAKMGRIESWQGFAATTMASATIYYASKVGIPLSTTHTITSAIAGANTSFRPRNVNWSVVGKIGQAWIFTFPICFALAYVSASFANMF